MRSRQIDVVMQSARKWRTCASRNLADGRNFNAIRKILQSASNFELGGAVYVVQVLVAIILKTSP